MSAREAIVCVDDDPQVLNALHQALRTRLGRRYLIETASNGVEALELLEELSRERTPTRVVVSDAMMPIMDGYELLRRVQESMPSVHKVLITGYGDDQKIRNLMKDVQLAGMFDKPWDAEALCSLIERTLTGPSPEA